MREVNWSHAMSGCRVPSIKRQRGKASEDYAKRKRRGKKMTITLRAVAVMTIFCIFAFVGTTRADDMAVRQPNRAEIGMTAHCPVLNSTFEIRRDTPVIDFKGKSYYFCCQQCVEDFKKNPDKFASAGELPLRYPTKDEIGKSRTCPVSKAEFVVVPNTTVIDYKGKSYYFCCSSCIDVFRKDPDKYLQ
jgi:YHS domain-containing protein